MVEYKVKVKPGSSQEKIVVGEDGMLTVYLRAKPHDGEANEALIKKLSGHFGVAKTKIRIKRGSRSREKVVEI